MATTRDMRTTESASSYSDDLRLAHVIADQVEVTTMQMFRSDGLVVNTKPDSTPVSDADTAAEEICRSHLARARTRDGVIGEEFDDTTGQSTRRWIIDPIDGTANYIRGIPVWATLIGLADGDDIVMGLVSAPALGRRWWAARGTGAWTGRSLAKCTRMNVSTVDSLGDATFSNSSLRSWREQGQLDNVMTLIRDVKRDRAFGDFWSYMLVAEGAVDIAAEPALALHDMAALAPIVTEAGGRFSSLDGTDGPWGKSAVATNGLLHDMVLKRLQ